ncbi:MAG: hypothetical protein IKU78_04045 [Paludibacteraceae bacterium]|nr:hypothetical protein [Paludibacteraceae bacterium]
MILSTVLLAGFWAAVGTFFKWALVVVGLICLIVSLVMIINTIKNNDNEFITSGIIAVPGILLTLWWFWIPYWNVCQWIVFAILILLNIYSESKAMKITFTSITIAYAVMLIVKYLIIPYLRISLVVLGALVSIAILTLICFVVNKTIIIPYLKRRRRNLCWKLKSVAGSMPIPKDAIFDRKSEKRGKKALKKFKSLNKKLRKAKDEEKRLSLRELLFEHKMYTFYEISLRAESKLNKDAYAQFEEQLKEAKLIKDISILRQDEEEHKILSGVPTSEMKFVLDWKPKIRQINCNNRNYSQDLVRNQMRDTRKRILFWSYTSTSKLNEQTEELIGIKDDMISELRRNLDIQEILNEALAKVRLLAYRNIYLGVELLEYDKGNASAKHLSTEKDYFETISKFEESINVFEKYTKINKTALREIQESVKKNISRIETDLLKGRGRLARTIEVMESIIQFNNQFIKTYVPLRKKVFFSDDTLSKEDMIDLARELTFFKERSIQNL